MTREDAERLLALSREASWTFPSSAGNPLDARSRGEQWVERLLAEQQSVVDAARDFVDAGELDAATELAANIWRLWMASRDIDGGRSVRWRSGREIRVPRSVSSLEQPHATTTSTARPANRRRVTTNCSLKPAREWNTVAPW